VALGELQDGVGGPCLIQHSPDQEHPLSHRSMATFVKVKQMKKNRSKPQERWSTEETAVIVM